MARSWIEARKVLVDDTADAALTHADFGGNLGDGPALVGQDQDAAVDQGLALQEALPFLAAHGGGAGRGLAGGDGSGGLRGRVEERPLAEDGPLLAGDLVADQVHHLIA